MKETIKIILNKESSIFWNLQSSPLITRSGVEREKKGGKDLSEDNDEKEELFTWLFI